MIKLFFIALIVISIINGGVTAYAAHPIKITQGIISKVECDEKGGTIVIDTTDLLHRNKIMLCKIDNKYLQVSEYTPLHQLKDGVLPNDVVCTKNLVLVLKISKNTVACLTPKTAEILILRHWGVFPST